MDGCDSMTAADLKRELGVLSLSTWALTRAAQRSASEAAVLRARVAELEEAATIDELELARLFTAKWQGSFAFHPAHTCVSPACKEVPDALVFVPDDGSACVVISDRLPAEIASELAALLNFPRGLLARAARRALITDGHDVITGLIAERDAAHDLVRTLENRVAELTAELAATSAT